jgi:eukaryotic-like serine/threonine-protein kinase
MIRPARIGEVIAGKYRVERVLGQGGMGVVVVARHLQLGERVAIKFPLARLSARDDVVVRWVREGRAAMRIRSQHVARVYDVGTLENGEPYLVMEYLVGRDLAAVLAEQGPLAVEEAVEHVLQATEALAEAHAQGIIHRDLKPSNLFLTRGADSSPVIKVLDFGAAKTTTFGAETPLTAPTGVVGTPLFMAPEQMRSQGPIDARADIWSLGATLYTLLTGKPPFSAGSLVEIHEHILRGAPCLSASRPDAPAALEAIVLRCMQTEPGERYASVAELAEALAAVAPEHARISAVRAARILSAPPFPVEPDQTSTGELVSGETKASLRTTESGAGASWVDTDAVGTMGTSVESPPRPSPSATRSAPRRPAVRSLLVLIVAGAVGAGGIEAAVRLRRSDPSAAPAGDALAIPALTLASSSAPPPATSPPIASSPGPLASRAVAAEDGGELVPTSLPPARGSPRSAVGEPPVRSSRAVTPDAAAPLPARSHPFGDPLADPN